MPLHGKIVVIKRSGGDGTEFPLTASCLFGRKPDCDIRIQLPQVSKEHCRIDLNENKEVILTNLSSVNPTRVNGEVFQQSERLKHGDLITIIDRSFRFEYPPAPTPKKKRSSIASSCETPQILHETQLRDTSTKDGTNSSEIKPKGDGILEQKNQNSPFGELYQMFKQDLDSKTPKKGPETSASRLYPTKLVSPNKVNKASVISTPKKTDANLSPADAVVTPKSSQKKRKSLKVHEVDGNVPIEDQLIPSSQEIPKVNMFSSQHETPTPVSQRKSCPTTPQRFSASEVVEQISECLTAETQNTPTRRTKEATPIKSSLTEIEPPVTSVTPDGAIVNEISVAVTTESSCSPRASPRSVNKKLHAQDVHCVLEAATPTKVKQSSGKKRKSGDLTTDLPVPMNKRKRVSFGGHLEPELFDKRLPPDSPLRKGATPGRRSLCVLKTEQSLLRRASVIGLIKKREQASPKSPSPAKKTTKASPKTPSPAKTPKTSPKTPSPAKTPKTSPKTPSPAKKTPKASPKTPSPAKTPKASPKTPSPAKTPKTSPKSPSPAKKTPKASPKTPSLATKSPKAKTLRMSPLKESQTPSVSNTPVSLPLAKTTPTVQGRFSVSRISTPSPTADQDSSTQTSVTVTPRVPLRRRSMKATPKSTMKNALQIIRRRSGLSRASMKVVNSWADIVKFGQTRTQAIIPAKKAEIRVTKKKTVVPKVKTPVKNLLGHSSTGHADSPVTIVVGKAHKLPAGQPAGAAPKLVHNIALQKMNMKMDEDFSGVAEIFKTPARQRNSVSSFQSSIFMTPQRAQSSSMIESSGMDTPEETGEMVVSPLVSTAKRGVYNSDAVIRLLDDQESSFIPAKDTVEAVDDSFSTSNDVPALEMSSEESEKQQPESTTKMSACKQKEPLQPKHLTGVKKILKTPRHKAEPIEDLRGKLLKTPKQKKPEQPECLTGVKRVMRTPRQKAEPIEDLRGKLLKTPKQKKLEQPECLTGVKRVMKTLKPIAVPVDDLRGKLLKTPRGPKTAQEESLDGVKDLLKSPKLFAQAIEDISGDAQNYFHSEKNEIHKTIALVALTKVQCKEPASTLDGVPKVGEPADAPAELIEEQASLEAVEKIEDPDSTEALEPVAASVVVETLGSEGPVPVKERKGKKPEVIEPPPARPSARGRSARQTSSVDAPVETVDAVDVQEKCHAQTVSATQPKSGGKVKQASVGTEENAVEVESLEMTPIEDQQPPSDVPVQKSRKGNAKQAFVEQVETVFESTLDAVLVHVPEKFETQTPVVKSTRGRKPETDSFETEVLNISPIDTVKAKDQFADVPVVKPQARAGHFQLAVLDSMEVDFDNAVVVEIFPTEEVDAPTSVAKPKKLKKNNQESLEQVEPVSVETPIEQVVAHQQTTVLAEPPKRGRKTKQAPLDHVQDQAVEAVTVPVEAEEQTTVAPAEKPKRGGRKTKQASLDHVDAVSVPVEAEEQTTVALVEKPKRGGRKTKQASLDHVEEKAVEAVTVQVVAEEQTTEALVEKPRRGGRKTKQASLDHVEEKAVEAVAVQVEADEQTTESLVEKPKKAGRRMKQASLDHVEPVAEQAVEAVTVQVEAEEQTTDALVVKPKRGGRKTKQVLESVVIPLAKEAPEETSEKPKRGRKGKQEKVLEVFHILEETEAVDCKPEHEETEAAEQFVNFVKSGRARKAVAMDVVPAKRARRGATDFTKVSTATEVPTGTVKRGRPLAKSTVSVDDPLIVAEHNPSEAKVTNTEVIIKVPKSTSKSVNWKSDLEITPLPKQRKSRRNDSAAICFEEQQESVEEQQVVKSVRGRRAKSNVEVEVKTTIPTQSKRARLSATDSLATNAETTNPVSKPVNKRNAARYTKKPEEADLSDKTVSKEPMKKTTRRAAKSTHAAVGEAPSTTVSEDVPEMVSKAEVVAATKERGKAPKRGKVVSQEIELEQATEQPTKSRRGRAARP